MKIRNSLVFLFITFVYLFLIQFLYDFRDNVNYFSAFKAVQDAPTFAGSYIAYMKELGASEPILFILQYQFSSFLSYVAFNHLINFLLLIVIYLSVNKYFKKNLIAFVIILLFDYYLYRLTGELHRFKLSMLFFLLFFLYFENTKYKTFSILLSILSHFQIAVVYLVLVIKNIKITRFIKLRTIFNILFLIVAVCVFFALYYDHFLYKLRYYLLLAFPLSTFIIGILYLSYVTLFKDKKNTLNFLYLFLVIASIAFFIGSDRVNIFLVEFIFIMELYNFLEKGKKHSLVILIPIIFYNIYRIKNLFSIALVGV